MSDLFAAEKQRFVNGPREEALRVDQPVLAQSGRPSKQTTQDGERLARVELIAQIAQEEFDRIEKGRTSRSLDQQSKGYLLEDRITLKVQKEVPGLWNPRRRIPGSVVDLYEAELRVLVEIKLTEIAATGSRQRHQWRAQVQAAVLEDGAVAKIIGKKTPFYFASFDEQGNKRYIRDKMLLKSITGPRGYATRGSLTLLSLLSTIGIFASELLDAVDPIISGVRIYTSSIKPLQIFQALKVASWKQVGTRLRLVEETNLMINEGTGELFVVVLDFEDEYLPGDILYIRMLEPHGRLTFRDPETGDLYGAIGKGGQWGVVQYNRLYSSQD